MTSQRSPSTFFFKPAALRFSAPQINIQLAKGGVAQTINDYEGVCHTVFRHTTPHQMESIRIVQLIRINSTALAKSPERALPSGNIIYTSAPTPRETSSVHTYRLQREGVLLRSYTIVTR